MEKSAIILVPDNSGLQYIYGMPAVRRLVILVKRLEFRPVHLIGHLNAYKPILLDLIPENDFHEIGASKSPIDIVNQMDLGDHQRILLMRADLVVDSRSLDLMIRTGNEKKKVVMTGDQRAGQDRLYLVGAGDVGPIVDSLWSPESSGFKMPEMDSCLQGAFGVPHAIGEGEGGRRISETKLLKALSLQSADDGFLARHVDRRISRFFSMRLSRTRVTPNHITILGVTIGMLGAFFLSQADYGSHVLGGVLFLLCVVVDGMDGEVARLKLQESEWGHYFDIISDNAVHVAIFVGIAVGLYRETGDFTYLKDLFFLLAGFALCVVSVYYNILRRDPEELNRSPWILRMMALMANRDFAYLLLALAIVNRLSWFFKGAVVGTFVFCGLLWVVGILENRAERERSKQ